MDLMARRRALLARVESGVINTSPKIDRYGYRLYNRNGETKNAGCCYTVFYSTDTVPTGYEQIVLDVGKTGRESLFQYWDDNEALGYSQYNSSSPQDARIGEGTTKVRFTLSTESPEDYYAYNNVTGQIFFAGKNTPYYGCKNINDMPTGT